MSKRSVMKMSRNSKGSKRVRSEPDCPPEIQSLSPRVEMIQALIPLGLDAVRDMLQQEVVQLAGERYARSGGLPGHARWGEQQGWVYLGDQKVNMDVPRVRNTEAGEEVRLQSYEQMQSPKHANELAMNRLLKGLSCRDYASCVDHVAETYGLSSSSLSRRFKEARDITGCLTGRQKGQSAIILGLARAETITSVLNDAMGALHREFLPPHRMLWI